MNIMLYAHVDDFQTWLVYHLPSYLDTKPFSVFVAVAGVGFGIGVEAGLWFWC